MSWACQQSLRLCTVVHVDTGWAAEGWDARVTRCEAWAVSHNMAVKTLSPPQDFAAQVRDRRQFPSRKFQWCAGFLKGLPMLTWLDEVDPGCEATILLGSRRADSRARYDLPERIDNSEHFGGRSVWYPLYDSDDTQRDALVKATGLDILSHRSLECAPCIHASYQEMALLSDKDRARLTQLEADIHSQMMVDYNESSLESLDMGCGAPYACGE